jgi:hypothetical protein
MLRRMSWVEWLAIALLVIACLLFAVGSAANPSGGWAGFATISYGILIAVVGFSLFLVRPLLLLGPRVPLWLIPVFGAILTVSSDPVCRALNTKRYAVLVRPPASGYRDVPLRHCPSCAAVSSLPERELSSTRLGALQRAADSLI